LCETHCRSEMPRSGKDFARLEAEYVTGSMSLRQISRDEGMSQSTIARVSRLNGWESKRAAYRASLSTKAYDLMSSRDAVKLAARNMQMLDIGDKVLTLFEKQMPIWQKKIDDGETPISVRDFKLVAELTRVIIGEPTERREERSLGLNLHSFDLGQLERFERAARAALPDAATGDGVSPSSEQGDGPD